MTPQEVGRELKLHPPVGTVAVDSETSGLYGDDGARVAVLSMAWQPSNPEDWELWSGTRGVSYGQEDIFGDRPVPICSIAWPFDQGVEGKPEDRGQMALQLREDEANLDLEQWRALLGLLSGLDLTMHPMVFDVEKIRVGVRRWPGVGSDLTQRVVWDTQLACDLLWATHSKGLKETHDRIWPGSNYGDAAKKVKDYLRKAKLPSGRWDLVPWEVIGPYADMDARMTKKIELRQKAEIDAHQVGQWLHYAADDEAAARAGIAPADGVYDAMARRVAVSQVLCNLERRGMPYDEIGSREAARHAAKAAGKLAEKLPFETREAKDFFFTEGFISTKGVEGLELVPYAMTEPSTRFPQGQPSLTAEVLGRMVADGVDWAEDYALWQKVDTARSMWYEGYAEKVGPDGRLRARLRQTGTRSTRFSIERVNLQAIPHDYRMSKALDGVPSPRTLIAQGVAQYEGWRLWEFDLQQAELRVGALMAKCWSMVKMIEEGVDLHAVTTKELFGLDESDSKFGTMRQVGKRANFSLGFGSGAKTFDGMISKETGIVLGPYESDRIVRGWNRLYPEWGRAIQKHSRVVERRQRQHGFGWLEFANGERRWFQPYEEAHKSFNQRVQGTLAQYGIEWLLTVERLLTVEAGLDPGPDGVSGGVLLPIHDSLVCMLPEDGGDQLAERIQEIGVELWQRWFPKVPGGVDSKAWSV